MTYDGKGMREDYESPLGLVTVAARHGVVPLTARRAIIAAGGTIRARKSRPANSDKIAHVLRLLEERPALHMRVIMQRAKVGAATIRRVRDIDGPIRRMLADGKTVREIVKLTGRHSPCVRRVADDVAREAAERVAS